LLALSSYSSSCSYLFHLFNFCQHFISFGWLPIISTFSIFILFFGATFGWNLVFGWRHWSSSAAYSVKFSFGHFITQAWRVQA